MQPSNGYYDYNRLGETDDPAKFTKLWISQFGTRFLVPAEYDVFVSFSPVGDDPILNADAQAACDKGSFKLWAEHVTDDEATALTQSTAKPFANYANADETSRNIMLKDLINYTPRLTFK